MNHKSEVVHRFADFVFTRNMEAARCLKGLTMDDMAEILNRTRGSYSNLENGAIEPKISDMIVVSRILEKPLGELFNFQAEIKEIEKKYRKEELEEKKEKDKERKRKWHKENNKK